MLYCCGCFDQTLSDRREQDHPGQVKLLNNE